MIICNLSGAKIHRCRVKHQVISQKEKIICNKPNFTLLICSNKFKNKLNSIMCNMKDWIYKGNNLAFLNLIWHVSERNHIFLAWFRESNNPEVFFPNPKLHVSGLKPISPHWFQESKFKKTIQKLRHILNLKIISRYSWAKFNNKQKKKIKLHLNQQWQNMKNKKLVLLINLLFIYSIWFKKLNKLNYIIDLVNIF